MTIESQAPEQAVPQPEPTGAEFLAGKILELEQRIAGAEMSTAILRSLLAKLGEKSDMRLKARTVPGGGLQLFWEDGSRIVLP